MQYLFAIVATFVFVALLDVDAQIEPLTQVAEALQTVD